MDHDECIATSEIANKVLEGKEGWGEELLLTPQSFKDPFCMTCASVRKEQLMADSERLSRLSGGATGPLQPDLLKRGFQA